MTRSLLAPLIIATALCAGCSPKDDAASNEHHHVWESQTRTIDQAKAVRDQVNAAAAAEQHAMDNAKQ